MGVGEGKQLDKMTHKDRGLVSSDRCQVLKFMRRGLVNRLVGTTAECRVQFNCCTLISSQCC